PYVVGVSAGACNLLGYVARQIGHTRDCMIRHDGKSCYFGFNQLIRAGKIINLDSIFYELPHAEAPFDFKTYFSSNIKNEMVVTNCDTGQAEYLHEDSDERRLGTIGKASSSVPLFTSMVELDGKRYLDGGLADSIPVKRAISCGFYRNVVILTRRKGITPKLTTYQKLLYENYYRGYPNLVKAILSRPNMYHQELALLSCMEEEEKVFVIRPELPEVKRFETDFDKLYAYYRHGYQIVKERWDSLQMFLLKEAVHEIIK
ncbi:MAG TPA: patatin family protein, partial [Anaerovoracaceae bacterium]|nr:patatin family protein [Anaerovoracaceae bacterium]